MRTVCSMKDEKTNSFLQYVDGQFIIVETVTENMIKDSCIDVWYR